MRIFVIYVDNSYLQGWYQNSFTHLIFSNNNHFPEKNHFSFQQTFYNNKNTHQNKTPTKRHCLYSPKYFYWFLVFSISGVFLFTTTATMATPKTHCRVLCPCSVLDMAPSKWQMESNFLLTHDANSNAETIAVINSWVQIRMRDVCSEDSEDDICKTVCTDSGQVADCGERGSMSCYMAQCMWMLR